MKLVCPSCGAQHSAEAWVNDALIRRSFGIISGLPSSVTGHALAYIALFRTPASVRGLSWKRAEKLLAELKGLTTAGWVQHKAKPARPATPEMWASAMAGIIEKANALDLPLTGHGLLRKIVWDAADKADRKAEVRRNQKERTGTYVQREPEPGERPSLEEMRAIRKQNKRKGQNE